MEININIAEILKDKPKGTKLYSSACGKCKLEEVDDKSFKISFYNSKFGFMNGGEGYLDKNGKLYDDGECVVFPSKEMRDWSKFAWKRGDVLVSNDGCIEVIFDKWYDDTYTSFYCKHYLDSEDENDIRYLEEFVCSTWKYSLKDTESFLCYVTTIENRLGGKLNFKTLEIEKNPASFKDGDIVVTDAVPSMCYSKCIFILKGGLNACESRASTYVFYNINNDFISFNIIDRTIRDRNIHLATDSEKKQLFNALTKVGKAWDAEKKQIVGLWIPKPFDKIVAFRELGGKGWVCDMFSHYSKNGKGKEVIIGIGGLAYNKALPFNEETAILIGTTNNSNKCDE